MSSNFPKTHNEIESTLANALAALGSWADEMEDVPVASDSRTGYGNDRRSFTQPSFGERSFGTDRALQDSNWRNTKTITDRYPPREPLPLPNKPPYTAHLGNLPFDATNLDIEEFFQDCEVSNIRIVEDKLERKPKGFGYVEFRSLDGLKKALTLDGTQFRGRSIRISVAEPRKTLAVLNNKVRDMSLNWRLAKNDRQEARELNDWTRKGPLPDLPQQQRRASDGRAFNKGYEAAPEMERGGSRRGAPAFEGDGKVRDFNNWERKGPLSPLPPPAGVPPVREGGRVRDGPPKDRKLSPSWGPGEGREGREGSRPRGEFRERPHFDKQPTPAELDNHWRTKMRPDAPAKSSNTPTPEPSAPSSPAQPPPPAVRPRLNLQKRTVSEAEPAGPAAPSDSKSSPFGAARPIDTAAREREIEEKRQLQMRLKKEAEEKAREEKRAKEAAAKETAEKATSPVQENGMHYLIHPTFSPFVTWEWYAVGVAPEIFKAEKSEAHAYDFLSPTHFRTCTDICVRQNRGWSQGERQRSCSGYGPWRELPDSVTC